MRITVRGKLVRMVVVILAMVCGMILSAVIWEGRGTQEQHAKSIAAHIKKGIVSKGTVLTENHALALKGLARDNALGDIRALIAQTVRDDPEVTVGLFLSNKQQPWAYFSPGSPPPKPGSENTSLAPSDT